MPENNSWQQPVWQQPNTPTPVPQQPAAYAPAPVPAPGQYQAYPPQYAPAPQPVAKKGKGWIVGLAAVIAIFLLFAIGMVSCTSMFSSGFSSSSGSSDIGYLTSDAVAVIPIDGTIQYDGTTSSPEGLKAKLDEAEENPHVKAVVLRVNSGGGTATAGEEMSIYVKDFSKPIVVSSASINASAAYEISSQTDYIFTAQTTAIGSIGTAMSFTDLSGLYEKLGITIEDVTSAESKDSSYGNRPLTEEELAYYQAMVDQINQTFIEKVAEGRGMDVEAVRKLATGLTFTGMTGVENGLADEIGTLEQACDKAAELAGIGDYTTVYLQDSYSSLDWLDILGASNSNSDLDAIIKELENDGTLSK